MKLLPQRFRHSNYSVDLNALSVQGRFFYIALALIIYSHFTNPIKTFSPGRATWLWPLRIMDLVPLEYQNILIGGLFLTSLLSCLAAAVWIRTSIFKILATLGFLLITAFSNSFGKIDHSHYSTLLASFGFLVLHLFAEAPSRHLHLIRAKFLVWMIQILVLSTYSLSGLWKLRFFMEHLFTKKWNELNPLMANIERNTIESFALAKDLPLQLSQSSSILLWILLMAFEICLPLLAWMPRAQFVGGLVLILFHTSTAYFVGVFYLPAALTAVVVLCMNPYRAKAH